jgi:hypothetical protein
VAEVISPGSGSERTDRLRKVGEYVRLGIPQYWIVEHTPPGSTSDSPADRPQPQRVTADTKSQPNEARRSLGVRPEASDLIFDHPWQQA